MSEEEVRHVKPFTRWQRLGIASAIVSGVFVLGAGVIAWTGLYNVSASTDHFPATTWFLKLVRDQSVTFHSRDMEAPSDLGRAGQIELGANHYRLNCANCHGTPGARTPPTGANLLPRPPDLTIAAERYTSEELAWIVRHGFKYTGMPAWPAIDRADETWPLVAFVEALNAENPDIYADQLTGPDPEIRFLEMPVTATCVMCHDAPGGAPVNPLVPVLSGQSHDYLTRALEEYRSGARKSGYMMPIAFALSDAEISDLATSYSAVSPPAGDEVHEPGEDAARGGAIARNGLPDSDVPACLSCHGDTRNAAFPSLYGQPESYLKAQLNHWQDGGRDMSDYGYIMSVIANRLSENDIEAVTGYFAHTSPPAAAGGAE